VLNFQHNIFDLPESKCSKFRLLISIKNLSKKSNFYVFLDRLIVQVMNITDEADFLTQHFWFIRVLVVKFLSHLINRDRVKWNGLHFFLAHPVYAPEKKNNCQICSNIFNNAVQVFNRPRPFDRLNVRRPRVYLVKSILFNSVGRL
jgi:hypothetical protein